LIAPRRQVAIEKVAGKLGNTPTICRKCYVHPEVLNSYMDGKLVLELKEKAESELRGDVHQTGRSCRPRAPAQPARNRSRTAGGEETARQGSVAVTRRSS
jgi:DNA topoisomerase-1